MYTDISFYVYNVQTCVYLHMGWLHPCMINYITCTSQLSTKLNYLLSTEIVHSGQQNVHSPEGNDPLQPCPFFTALPFTFDNSISMKTKQRGI